VVDAATRNVQVQATLANADGKLRPGMYVQARLLLGSSSAVVALPASAINYAPYGDSVFIVEDLKSPKGQIVQGRQTAVRQARRRARRIRSPSSPALRRARRS